MSNSFFRGARRSLLLGVALLAGSAASASAAVVDSGAAAGGGYAGSSCTVSAQLHSQRHGDLGGRQRQLQRAPGLHGPARRPQARHGALHRMESPAWANSYGQGNAWYTTGSTAACARGYAPLWQSVVTALLYDYNGRLVNQVTATTGAPRVLCRV